jgi:peptidoglycan/LPS O-acetylase OafA/YrhL
VLSGFVISYVYQGAVEEGRFRYGSFLWARIARIYPLHLVTLAAVAVMGLAAAAVGVQVAAEVFDPASLPANLLMIHAWGFAPTAAFNHPPGRSRRSGSLTSPSRRSPSWRLD